MQNTAFDTYSRNRYYLNTSLFEATDDPITINYVMDISRDFTDSATADSLMKDVQTPATITALSAGTANPLDALDFKHASADGFAEGDGAYVYTAGSGIAHFKFVNTVTHFSPAFRIKSWTFASLPEYVTVDNQTLVQELPLQRLCQHRPAELIIQFNRTFAPGTHVFYISHKTGLAVTLNRFEAVGGEGVDTPELDHRKRVREPGLQRLAAPRLHAGPARKPAGRTNPERRRRRRSHADCSRPRQPRRSRRPRTPPETAAEARTKPCPAMP